MDFDINIISSIDSIMITFLRQNHQQRQQYVDEMFDDALFHCMKSAYDTERNNSAIHIIFKIQGNRNE